MCDSFPPTSSSAANQIYDLSIGLSDLGIKTTILIPDSDIKPSFLIEESKEFRLIRIKTLKTKDINLFRRTLGEFLMPHLMINTIKKNNLINFKVDGVIWYSPSIFFGPLVRYIKKKNSCKTYLILRDIFPEWAVDMGLLGRGPIYLILKLIAKYQYSLADKIGIQSKGNHKYFKKHRYKVEVLHNWLTAKESNKCSVNISNTILSGRKIFVYAGNMGVAQDIEIFIKLAQELRDDERIGFLFIGRGKKYRLIEKELENKKLNNAIILNEINNKEMQKLYLQCYVGILSLDLRHKSHNIPGKFISYLHHGLPVLASVNKGNDLIEFIQSNDVGKATCSGAVQDLKKMCLDLINDHKKYLYFKENCKKISTKYFSSQSAAKQISNTLKLL